MFKKRQRIWRHQHLVDVCSAHGRRRARIHLLRRIQREKQGEDGCMQERQEGGEIPPKKGKMMPKNPPWTRIFLSRPEIPLSGGKRGRFQEEGEDDAKKRGENGEDFPPRNGEDSQNEAESPLSTIYQLNPRLQHTRCRGRVNAYPRRNAWWNQGETRGKTGKIPGRRGGKEENGEDFPPRKGEDGHGEAAERGKIQRKRGRFGRKGKIGNPIHRYSTTEVTGSRSTTAQVPLLGSQQQGT